MITRRTFFPPFVAAATLSLPALLSFKTNAGYVGGNAEPIDDLGFVAGCFIACEGASESARASDSVDFWTSRVGYFGGVREDLPPHFRRTIIWDDFFSLRRASSEIAEILDTIPSYYGFDARAQPNHAALHLGSTTHLTAVMLQVYSTRLRRPNPARQAIIDIDAAGPTSLTWSVLLPHLRSQYDYIVGISQDCELIDGEFDIHNFCHCYPSACFSYCNLVMLARSPQDYASKLSLIGSSLL